MYINSPKLYHLINISTEEDISKEEHINYRLSKALKLADLVTSGWLQDR